MALLLLLLLLPLGSSKSLYSHAHSLVSWVLGVSKSLHLDASYIREAGGEERALLETDLDLDRRLPWALRRSCSLKRSSILGTASNIKSA
jgi:hypothetical protein